MLYVTKTIEAKITAREAKSITPNTFSPFCHAYSDFAQENINLLMICS